MEPEAANKQRFESEVLHNRVNPGFCIGRMAHNLITKKMCALCNMCALCSNIERNEHKEQKEHKEHFLFFCSGNGNILFHGGKQC